MAKITRAFILFGLVFPVWIGFEFASVAVAQKVVRFVIKPGMVQKATTTIDELGRPSVRIELTRQAALQFGELTGNNVGNDLELVIDGKVVVKARIVQRINGEIQLSGNYTLEEAQALARKIQPNQSQNQWFQQLSQVLEFVLRLFRGR
jgi:hypothetical protein